MYCKIFVNYQGDKTTLLDTLAKELQAKSIDITHYFSLEVTYILVVMMSMTLKRCNELMVSCTIYIFWIWKLPQSIM